MFWGQWSWSDNFEILEPTLQVVTHHQHCDVWHSHLPWDAPLPFLPSCEPTRMENGRQWQNSAGRTAARMGSLASPCWRYTQLWSPSNGRQVWQGIPFYILHVTECSYTSQSVQTTMPLLWLSVSSNHSFLIMVEQGEVQCPYAVIFGINPRGKYICVQIFFLFNLRHLTILTISFFTSNIDGDIWSVGLSIFNIINTNTAGYVLQI